MDNEWFNTQEARTLLGKLPPEIANGIREYWNVNDDKGQLVKDIDIVARAEIVAALEYELLAEKLSHESCPDVGEYDWDRIEARIRAIMEGLTPDDESRANAYARLIKRAESTNE